MNSKDALKNIQNQLQDIGYYQGDIDGIWGKLSQDALDKALENDPKPIVNDKKDKVPESVFCVPKGSYSFSKRSLKNLEGVHPHLVEIAHKALAKSPYDFMITEGLRTNERQAEMVRTGASKTYNSRHLKVNGYSHAIDIAIYVDGKISWNFDHYKKVSKVFKEVSKELGYPIKWGGDWRSLRDGPHFQLTWKAYPKK